MVEELVPQGEYDLQIQPDSHNHRYRVWFYFSISNARKKQVIIDAYGASKFMSSCHAAAVGMAVPG